MASYIARRLAYMILTLFFLSLVAYIIIELPPGDFVTSYVAQLVVSGRGPSDREAYEAALRKQYGLDQTVYIRYLKWASRTLRGDFGQSLAWRRPIKDLISERLAVTIGLGVTTLIFIYIVSIPIGVYSATHQYSIGDFGFTIFGFAGLAIPQFLLALILMFLFFNLFDINIGSLFSPRYESAAWSIRKIIDLIKHLPIPILVIGLANTASVIRVMRGSMLDELGKQYVITARSKGVSEGALLFKYPVRLALNPIVSSMGFDIPWVISAQLIAAVVLNLPTLGPLLLNSLLTQDMNLAASIILFLGVLTMIGTFVSDVSLAFLDPRIRLEASNK